MEKAFVKEIYLDKKTREIKVNIYAENSIYVKEPTHYGFPSFMNSGILIEGFNYVLEYNSEVINAMKGNKDFTDLIEQNRKLKQHILYSDLAVRLRQFLSSIDYSTLTDYQAKCVLLLEQELKTK